MKKVVFFMLSLLIFGALIAGCKSQTVISNETEVVEFSGIVTTHSNIALEGVKVTVGANVASAITDSNGVFLIDTKFAPGTYDVTFEKSGYVTLTNPYKLIAGKCTISNLVKLEETAP